VASHATGEGGDQMAFANASFAADDSALSVPGASLRPQRIELKHFGFTANDVKRRPERRWGRQAIGLNEVNRSQ
jgi:hypothetical protein